MDGQFLLTFPVYVLLLKDATGTIFLRHDRDLWLPLFTDSDAVETYLAKSSMSECIVLELTTPADLASFLRNPPSRAAGNDIGWVVIDPVDISPRTVTLLTVQQVLASLID